MLELLVLIFATLTLNPVGSAVPNYTLEYHDYWVGGERGSVTYTVQGNQLHVLGHDEHGAVVEDATRSLTEEEQRRGAELAGRALAHRDAQQCADAPMYRITAERGSQLAEQSYTVCYPASVSPFSELEELLAS